MAYRFVQPLIRSNAARSILNVSKQQVRNDGIFTKYREPPNGFLFNRKPLKPGEKRQWEDWEPIWYVGWGTATLIAVVGLYFKPDDNLLDWARREAEIRIAEIEAAEAE